MIFMAYLSGTKPSFFSEQITFNLLFSPIPDAFTSVDNFTMVKAAAILLFSWSALGDVSGPGLQELRPFATDGCTMAPDGTPGKPNLWRHCCVAHDLRFWGGGSKPHREDADKKLKACVASVAGDRTAEIFFSGVRLGQLSPWKIPSKRWGNAWYNQPPYRQLAKAEVSQLLDSLNALPIPSELRETYRMELIKRLWR
jgi:hypothetical protein